MADGILSKIDGVLGGTPPNTAASSKEGTSYLDRVDKAIMSPPSSPFTGGGINPTVDLGEFDINLTPNTNNELRRAQAQSTIEQTGLYLGNLLPNIALGITEGIGHLANLGTDWGDDRDYSNALVEFAKQYRNPLGEVYQEEPNEVFSMGDPAWWLNNVGAVAETAASFAALGAGLGSLFLRATAGLGRLGSTAAQVGRAAAQTATASSLAYAEGAMEAYDVYQKTFDTQLTRGLAQGLGTQEAEERARHMASQSAASTSQINTVINTALIMPQLSALFRHSDDIRSFFIRGAGARGAKESLGEYAVRLGTLGIPKEQAWIQLAKEAGGEGLEELTNLFASSTGEALGQADAQKGFFEQFGELSNFVDRTANEEGALSFMLGAIGGVAQTALINRIPIHRQIQRDPATGQAIPVLDRTGNTVDGKHQIKFVSSLTRNEAMKTDYFENIRGAILKDIQWFNDKQAELVQAVSAGDEARAKRLRLEIGTVSSLNAPSMGMTENWVREYQDIGNIDNTKRLAEPFEEEAAQLKAQGRQMTQAFMADEGVANPTDLSPEAQAQLAPIRSQFAEVNQRATELGDNTEAMQRGFAISPQDNRYRDDAQKQVARIRNLQGIYDRVQRNLANDERSEAAQLADFIYQKRANLYLRQEAIAEDEAEVLALLAENDVELSRRNLTPEQMMQATQLRDRRIASDNLSRVEKEIAGINKMTPADQVKTLSRYGITDFDPQDPKSVKKGIEELKKELSTFAEEYRRDGEGIEERLAPVSDAADLLKLGDDLRSRVQSLEQQKIELTTAQEDLDRLDTRRGREQFIRDAIKATKARTKVAEETIAAQNKEIEAKHKDTIAALELSRKQINFTIRKNNRTIAEREAQMTNLQTELDGVNAKYDAMMGTFMGKMRSVLFPNELGTNRKTLIARISSYREEIRRLREQNEELAAKDARLAVSTSGTPITDTSIPTTTDTSDTPTGEVTEPGEVTDVELTDTSLASYSELVPSEVDVAFNTWLNSKDGITLRGAISMMGKILKEHNVNVPRDQFREVISQEVERLWSIKQSKPTDIENKGKDAALSIQSLLDSIPDVDDRDEVNRIVAAIVEGRQEFDWDALREPIMFGNISAPKAAQMLQAVEQLMTYEGPTATIPVQEFTEEITEVVTGDITQETGDNLFEGDTSPESSPDSTDSDPIEEPIIEDEPDTDIPEPGVPSDPETQPTDGPHDPAVLESSRFHVGAKAIDGLRIANMTLAYEEGIDDNGNYYIRTSTNEINTATNPLILRPNALRTGQRVRLEVDTEWQGTVNRGTEAGQQPDSFNDYTAPNGSVVLAPESVGNVPIKIVDDVSGTTLGYLPRVDWITAQYEGAVDYRNVTDVIGEETGNVMTQYSRVMAVRNKVVKRFNANREATPTVIADRGPGHVILNREDGQVTPRSAKNMLPDTSLQIGIVSGGVIKTSKSAGEFDGNLIVEDLSPFENGAFALLPMPNGEFGLARLNNESFADRPFDITTMLSALEAYLSQNRAVADQYMALTGFDILSDAGIRNFINQHYTFTQSFPKTLLQADAPSRDGQPRQMKFLFSITDRGSNRVGEVAIGYSYSGKPKLIAALGEDGRLKEAFINEFTRGISTRNKNVVYTRLESNIYGINSQQPINEVVWNNRSNKLQVRAEHSSYNEYVKSFSATPVNGTNQLEDGTYVYSANPQNILDMAEVQRTLVPAVTEVEVTTAAIETTSTEEVTEEPTTEPAPVNSRGEIVGSIRTDGSEVLSDEAEDNLDNFGLFKRFISTPNNIDGVQSLTLEVLENLLTFTPVSNRNGKSTVQVYSELRQQGITQILPGFNPFFKC